MGRRRCNLGGSCTVRFVPANYQHLEQVGLLAKAGTTRQTYTTRPRRHSRAALSRSRRPVASACPVLPVSFAFATIVKHWAPHALHGRHPAAVPLPFVTSRTAAAPSKHSLKLPSLPAHHRACWAEYRHHRRPPRDSTPSPPRELREPPHDALDAADALALVRPLPRPPARPWTSPTCASPVRPHAAASSTTANSTQSLPQMVSTSAMSSVRRRPPPALSFGTPLTCPAGFPDPFAVATISGEQTRTTSVIKKTLNPYWNESFDMCVLCMPTYEHRGGSSANMLAGG